VRAAANDPPRRLGTAHAGHLQVHKDDVGQQVVGEANGFLAGGNLPDKRHVVGSTDQAGHTLAKEGMVVGQHHPR
jgi:hypothetical protein